MAEETKAQSEEQPTAKMVPESDLMAVKHNAEKEVGVLKTQVTEITSARDTIHNNLIQMQAAKEQLEEQLKEGVATKSQVDELQTKLTAAESAVGNLTTRLLDLKKVSIEGYGYPADQLQNKTSEQLEEIEATLKLIGKTPQSVTVDVGGGGAGVSAPVTPFDVCKQELADLRKK